ncbi:hypothetical protein [Cuniculiplasma divulgatum]|uniref:hypothetical protein n=1 Tax=Cuniculiplasma divulgatum TaxID=1673428 RepID=UPI00097D10E4|nr:hypothetical protein [Cuniculiplasma divulgatum]
MGGEFVKTDKDGNPTYEDWDDKRTPPPDTSFKGYNHPKAKQTGNIPISVYRVAIVIFIWYLFAWAGQGALYFDALGLFIGVLIAFPDKIYKTFRKGRRGY